MSNSGAISTNEGADVMKTSRKTAMVKGEI